MAKGDLDGVKLIRSDDRRELASALGKLARGVPKTFKDNAARGKRINAAKRKNREREARRQQECG